MKFKGRVALVTGAASGIGRACAVELARGGASVAVVDIAREDVLAEASHTLKAAGAARVASFSADVSDFERAGQVVSETVGQLGSLDILVNAAGVTADAPLWTMTEAQWDRVLGVNLKGTFNYVRAAARVFRERGAGKIVNLSSIEAQRGRFGLANYAASKAGVNALTLSAAAELGRDGINVNSVAPGFTRTPMIASLPESVLEEAARESLLGRIAEPEDIARVVAFLCSEDARHITGEVIRVDGGQLV